ncbi:LOW QUALITY PROTEIN: hypothetical protein QYF61_003728 [Mycteria americana]|uniref:Uncharacterized protein n=1 Tax=Mycteria americana TaxID=33587 RepID=A0AAN7PPT5_MYCAM|nr:LOW QUALITY PROTEIN: hypothetical protein QYF61_003728 [Mycteria americana]
MVSIDFPGSNTFVVPVLSAFSLTHIPAVRQSSHIRRLPLLVFNHFRQPRMRRPEVTSGQQSRVKKEAEDDSHTTRLDKGQKKKVETSNSHKESVGGDLEVIRESMQRFTSCNRNYAFTFQPKDALYIYNAFNIFLNLVLDMDGDSTTSLGSLCQCLTTLSMKTFFPISNLNLPWHNLKPLPLSYGLLLGRRDRPPPLYNLLSVVESNMVSPQPPFLQAKQPQFPQLLLIRLTLHQLRCPSLDTLQHLNVSLVVRGPKLNTGLEVRPHQCRVQGHDHFPSPAGHAISDTSQDAISLLGPLGTLLAHIQPAIEQHPQVLFHQAAFQPLFPNPVALHGVVVTQVQDLALGLVERHTIGLSPSIQPSLPPLKQINTPTQLGVFCKLNEGALDPFIQIIDKDIKQNWPQHRALGNTTCDRLPTGVNSIHHSSLGPAIQPVLYPAKSTPIQAMSSQFLQENAVGNHARHLVIEGDQVTQAGPAFHKPMLTGPGHLVVPYMPHDGTQDDLLHNLPWHRASTNLYFIVTANMLNILSYTLNFIIQGKCSGKLCGKSYYPEQNYLDMVLKELVGVYQALHREERNWEEDVGKEREETLLKSEMLRMG